MNKTFYSLFVCSILFCFIACNNSDGPAYSIAPPFKSITPVYDTFTLNASELKMFHLASGSSIEIPANAFVDKNGKVVTGKVALKYREFHSAADILASGIPMLANNEEGNAKSFESGGMFEITATANGEEINIAKDKKINVHFASKIEGDFDFYYLEEDEGKKVETASLFLQAQAPVPADKQYRWKKIYTASEDTLKNGSAERKKNPNAKYLQAHFDTKKYAETAALDTIKWEYAGITKTDDLTDPSNAFFQKQTWSEASISKPVFYTEKVRQIDRIKTNNHFRELILLPDSLGILAHDGDNNLSYYGWDGTLKTRFKDVITTCSEYYGEGGYRLDFTFINKQNTHLLLLDKDSHCKLFLMNGTLVKDLGLLHNASFDQAGTKIIGQTGIVNKEQIYASIFSLTGALVTKIPVNTDPANIGHQYYDISSDQSKIAFVNKDKLVVADMDGKMLSTSSGINKIQYWHFIEYNEAIVIYTADQKLFVWDWKKGKLIHSEKHEQHYSSVVISPKNPEIIIQQGEYKMLWDWEKNMYKKIVHSPDAYSYGINYSPKGDFIYAYEPMYVLAQADQSNSAVKTFLFNDEGKLLKSFTKAQSYSLRFDENEERILITGDTSEIYLLDRSGKMLFDFKAYDPEIVSVWFNTNGDIISTTKNSTVVQWDKNAKLLHSVVTNKRGMLFYPGRPGVIHGKSRIQSSETWDIKSGKALYAYDNEFIYELYSFGERDADRRVIIPNTYILSLMWSKTTLATIWKNSPEKLPADIYQLAFRNDSASFQTYVYLNSGQLELMNQYQKALDARIKNEIKKEAERVEEEDKLIRSFAINNFGIYNWDRFYKDTNAIFVKATMELDKSITEFNNITFFLITGKDRNVVVKYYTSTLEKFCFVPEDNNLLLAVLPDDRVAVFEEEEFRKLNPEELKKNEAYTFKLKILEGAASKAVLDKILQKPS